MAQYFSSEADYDLGDSYLEENYYSLLNVDKDASTDDISNAYRRLSKIYHPDKHSDPVQKKNAEILFNKTKAAYEVLSDPHKRAIYDTLGLKGLETEGWQIVQRTKTPQEIREEYEQLLKEREERRLQQRTNPKGVFSVGVNATDIFDSYDLDNGVPHIEISSMNISQSVEVPLSLSNTLTLNGNLTSQNGVGSGTIGCSVRKVVSAKTWAEGAFSAGNGLVFTLKGFRTISKTQFGSMQGTFHITPLGIAPGVQVVLGQQLDKHTAGYLTWKGGSVPSMTSTVVWDSSNGHFAGSLQLGLKNSFISLSYVHKFEDSKLKGSLKLGTFGAAAEYGCEKKISQHSVLGASVSVGVPSGVMLKIKLNRANQTYMLPIMFSEEIIPSAVFYGTMLPIVGWFVLKVYVIDPYHKRQKERETERAQELYATKLAEKKKEATAAVSLMQETYNRIKLQEESKNGLVIIKAMYGVLSEINETDTESNNDSKVIDVTIPLQCLVKNSRLTLPAVSKCDLPGFYDPCLGEDKCLLVNYSFRNVVHSVTINDKELLKIPD